MKTNAKLMRKVILWLVLFSPAVGIIKPAYAKDPIILLYEKLLGREPDAPGYKYWTTQLHNGQPIKTIATGFYSSPEYLGKLPSRSKPTALLTKLYKDILGRSPDGGGLKFWSGRLAQGTPVDQIVRGFYQSPEYASKPNGWPIHTSR